jgi:isoquinoline 1-oxidoreductase subunit beta
MTLVERRLVVQSLAAAGGALLLRAVLPPVAWSGTGTGAGAAAGAGAGAGAASAAAGDFGVYLRISADGATSIVVPAAELGQGVYTTLPKIVAEELDADWSRTEVRLAAADPAYGNPDKKGLQSTGNSDSVAGYYTALREVGASARDLLVRAAAARWVVAAAECRTERGHVVHDASGRRADYGSLAAAAALLTPADRPVLKRPDQFTLLGRSTGRKDSPAKCDGSAEFGADLRLPGTVFGAVALAPVPGSRLRSFDRDAALRRRGVLAVLEIDGGLGAIAETTWAAQQALLTAAPVFEPPEGLLESSEDVAAALLEALDRPGKAASGARGDVGAAFAAAPPVLDATYEVAMLAHACMEPMAATALIEDGSCRVWAPHQRQGAAREEAARLCGLPLERVTLQGTFCGGGFGRKWELDFVRHVVQLAKAVEGRPVALTWSREADIRRDYFRAPFAFRARAALDAAGGIAGLHVKVAGPSLLAFQRRPLPIADPSSVGNAILPQYAIANRLVEFVERPIRQDIGFWRAVSLSQNGFVGESVIDELAHLARQDPLLYRRALLAADARALALLDRLAQASGWRTPLPAGNGRGRGIAFAPGFGSYHAQVAEVRVTQGVVRVERVTCVHDCGFAVDPDNVVAQMESGIVFGLSALEQSITTRDGAVVESNFHDFPMLRFGQMPKIEVHLIDSGAPLGGAGESATAAIAPAVANAIFSATGQRVRRLPLRAQGLSLG